MTVTLEGLPPLLAQLGRPIANQPARNFLTRGALIIEGKAKHNVSVWQGPTRQSITHVVDGAGLPLWADIGTNKDTGKWLELGTRPHFPPWKGPKSVEPWALSKGLSPFGVALAISRHGTKAAPWLKPAYDSSIPQVQSLLVGMAKEIEAAATG